MSAGVSAVRFSELGLFAGILSAGLAIASAALLLHLASFIGAQYGGLL